MPGVARDDDFLDVLVIKIADRTLDQVAFLIDEARRGRLQRQVANAFPETQQIFEIALDLLLRPRGAGSADDEPHALRNLEFLGDGFQTAAILRIGDLARDATTASGVRHQNGVAAGERQIRRESRALVAAFFLDDLNQDDLAALDDFLDLVAARAATLARARSLAEFRLRAFVVMFVLDRAVVVERVLMSGVIVLDRAVPHRWRGPKAWLRRLERLRSRKSTVLRPGPMQRFRFLPAR